MPADFKSQVIQALLNAWWLIQNLGLYLAGGILLAAVLNTFISFDRAAKFLKSPRWWMLPVAGLAGLVFPACTYGTVPVFVTMIKRGASMAPAATFLVASALVTPQIFVLTAGALGVWVAIAQAAASFAFAVAMGALVSRLAARGLDLEGSELKAARKSEETHSHPTADEHMKQHSGHHHKHAAMKRLSWPRRLGLNVLDLTEFVGFYFVMGTLIAALAAQFVPAGAVMAALGQGKWWAVPFASVVSIPTYVCGGGTIPLLASLTRMGMSTGAVLAFLIAGPATRITALAALAVLFKKRAVAAYVILLLAFATVLGIALGQIVQSASSPTPLRPIY